jgi:hypothetical protein
MDFMPEEGADTAGLGPGFEKDKESKGTGAWMRAGADHGYSPGAYL